MFRELRSLDIEQKEVDELVALLAFAKIYKAEFDAESIATPEWVDDRIRSLKRELQIRNSDQRAKLLRELKAQRESLLTAAEKRTKLDEQIAALEATAVV